MDLWIRSQDKERLVKVDKIEFYENKNKTDDEYKKCAIYEYTDSERRYLLGIYKSKERALEVLDEIQNLIGEDEYMHISQTKIYEMPKEEEK